MKSYKMSIIAAAIAVGAGQSLSAETVAKPGSLYERLGGKPAIEAVVDDFVSRILADERVNGWFAHAASKPELELAFKRKLADFVCQGTGGPCAYAGADMITAHKGRGVTEAAFNAVVSDLVATLNKLKVPEKEKTDLLAI